MEIEELRVKITAEMTELRKTLEQIKSGMRNVEAKVKETEKQFNNMGTQASNSVRGTAAAIDATKKSLQGLVNNVSEVIAKYKDLDGAMAGISSKSVIKLNFTELREELADTETRIKELYAELDEKSASLSGLTNPADIAATLLEIAQMNGELDEAEKNAQ